MISRKASLSELAIGDIEITSDRLRIISEAKVVALVDVITEFGFLGQITVRRVSGIYRLINGAHRLEAMRRLGRETIPAEIVECNNDEALQLEISTNLVAGMTPLQDAIFLAEWQQTYEKLHPETKAGMAGALAKHGMQGDDEQVENGLQRNFSSFAEVVAESRQITARQVRKVTAAARKLTPQERVTLQSATTRVSLADIEVIGKIGDPDERSMVVLILSAGNAKSAAEARRTLRVENGVEAPVQDPIEQQLKALKTAWSRASAAARRRWLEDAGADVAALMPRPEVAAE